MPKSDYQNFVRTALLLALTVMFQSLRLVVPLPFFLSTIIIGTLVNTCLLVAGVINGEKSACTIAVAAPVVAFFQQMLPLPVLTIPVAIGNLLYIWLFLKLMGRKKWQCIVICAISKAMFMYGAVAAMLLMVNLPPKVSAGLMFAMSWPQFVTAAIGVALTLEVSKRIQAAN
jgi:hypothetical protein